MTPAEQELADSLQRAANIERIAEVVAKVQAEQEAENFDFNEEELNFDS